VTRGWLCPKARFQLARHRSGDRLETPLVRRGDALVEASWEAALDLVADRLLRARERSGSLAVVHYWFSGSMGLLKDLYQRLFNLFGGVTEPHGSLCWSAGLAAQEADFGRVLSHDPRDLAAASAVLIWGRNPVDTNPHLVPFVEETRAAGAPVVVIDPVRTATARRLADRHIAPRPGTDAVLALAVAGELLRRGAYDREFCEERAAGFEDYARAAAGLGLEAAARACGVMAADILFLADILETRRPAALLIGYGLQRHRRGGEAVRAIDALAALTGNVGRSGGGANYANRHSEGLLRDLSGEEFARARRFFPMPALGRELAALRDPGVEVFFCDRANPAATAPNAKEVVQALRGVGFKVVAEIRPTDTTALADVVLPAADFLEDEDLYRCSWHTYFTWATPAVSPPGLAWPETRIIRELAARLGFGEEFIRTPREWIAYALEPLAARCPGLAPGGDIMRLRGTFFPNPAARAVPWSDGRFATPSGRFEFGREWGCLEDVRSAASGRPASGPPVFHLVTPRTRWNLHSQFFEEALRCLSRGSGLPPAFLHPRAAVGLGLADGETVVVRTAQGELKVRLVTDDGVREDTVLLYAGGDLGLARGGEPTSANLLTPDTLTDIGLQAAYYDCTCTVSRAERRPGRAGTAGPATGRAAGPTAPHLRTVSRPG
jgi:anaerobic selenocysteine-containing dehydrogenase